MVEPYTPSGNGRKPYEVIHDVLRKVACNLLDIEDLQQINKATPGAGYYSNLLVQIAQLAGMIEIIAEQVDFDKYPGDEDGEEAE